LADVGDNMRQRPVERSPDRSRGRERITTSELALVPYSFPTYANALGRAAIGAALELDGTGKWATNHLVDSPAAVAAEMPVGARDQ
jgi:hypothetical protein